MDNLNVAFFEAYKRLDTLCRELYGNQQDGKSGVTCYIDDMKETAWRDRRSVPYWDEDLEELIRLRHIRNRLAHAEGSLNETACTQSDIVWLRAFRARILDRSDPLAVLYRQSKPAPSPENSLPAAPPEAPSPHEPPGRRASLPTVLLLLTAVLVLTAALLWAAWRLLRA